MTSQSEFDFDAAGSDGYYHWLTGRKKSAQELAQKLNLPLFHQVEVWLVGGIRLRGRLTLQEEFLLMDEEQLRHLPLKVDHVIFHIREMESCVRLD